MVENEARHPGRRRRRQHPMATHVLIPHSPLLLLPPHQERKRYFVCLLGFSRCSTKAKFSSLSLHLPPLNLAQLLRYFSFPPGFLCHAAFVSRSQFCLTWCKKRMMQMRQERIENASSGEVAVSGGDRFLPRIALRVLLVEADDSTRQIISALLRKCSYRVAAVSDGLKAWETLKNKAAEIDLILTEVELPSISGFSLLTSIMEHDVCKSIPVIMMSSNDSVSMVFKCMLRGAADFLIKPVRKNELRNLWQHVWRRDAISSPPQSLTLAQNKLEVARENNAESNNSSGSVASMQKNTEYSEKTSEAQDTSQLKSASNLSNIDTVKHGESAKQNDEAGEKSIKFVSETSGSNKTSSSTGLRLDQGYDYNETENQDEDLRTELSEGNPTHINTKIHECNDELVEPSRGAIDLIATFENLPKSTDENYCFYGDNAVKFHFDTRLELSLRRDFPGSSCKHATEESQILNHSNASAFSRYSSSKLLQPLFPTQSITSAKLSNVSCNSHGSNKLSENTNSLHQYDGKNQNQNMTTLVTGQAGKVELQSPNNQLEFFPTTGVTSDHKSTVHGNAFPSMLGAQSGVHPTWAPKPVCQKESSPLPTRPSSQSNPESHNLECHRLSDDATFISDQNDKSNLDCGRHDSPATGLYPKNHDSGAYGSMGSGSDANASSAAVANNNPVIDSSHHSYDGFRGTDTHGTSQREAALAKFRLKRKDRCYEKKVRYQSRKRLAEQRPRVKGQFVRHIHNDNSVAVAGCGS